MKEKLILIANIGLFAAMILVLGTIQTSLWFQIFGYFPPPLFWMPCLVYVALSRSTFEAVAFAYLSGFILSAMTAMPEGILMTVCLGIVLGSQVFKQRIHWSGASYFMMVSGIASLMFHIFHWATTWIFGDHPMVSPQIGDWLISSLLTPLVAPVLLPILHLVDHLTDRETSNDVTAQIS